MPDYRFTNTFSYTLVYVYAGSPLTHEGLLKVGEHSFSSNLTFDRLPPNCDELNRVADERIAQQTNTYGGEYHLLHTELVYVFTQSGGIFTAKSLGDHPVHDVLKRSGIQQISPNGSSAREWFRVDLETVKRAISAVKQGRRSLLPEEITEDQTPIVLRKEQREAIAKTLQCFKSNKTMLWNAKMRFGKTITALELIKRAEYGKTIIFTHRPVVDTGWYEDYKKVFFDRDDFIYGSKNLGEPLQNMLALNKNGGMHVIYFASIQDLRGSSAVGGKFEKNDEVFNVNWDLVIVDEAHEGTQTALGDEVIKAVVKKKSLFLALSGTPFNILNDYDDDSVFTWDYVMEQKAKTEWAKTHGDEFNPYACLPQMHIYTYELNEIIRGYSEVNLEGKAFNFREFFRTWTGDVKHDGKGAPEGRVIGDFVHKEDIVRFLDIITKADEENNYPYSTQKYRDMFKHTLWMVPGVKEAQALEGVLRNHDVFRHFGIANVAGEGDYYEETHYDNALEKVRKTISDYEYSITLSCGKLTTGVTVKEWTAVLMLAGSHNTAASTYMQTIFRVQSPCNVGGLVKEHCYVFDFAPDRTLKVLAEAAKLSRNPGSGGNGGNDNENRDAMATFLNFCPVISVQGAEMKPYSVSVMMQQIKRIFAEKAIRNGFDDMSIYNVDKLMHLDGLDAKAFDKLKGIIGTQKASAKMTSVTLTDNGFTEEEREAAREARNTKAGQRTPEQLALLERQKKQRKERDHAISILRGISIRMPLLIYGADVPFDEDISLDRFVEMVDDVSWAEFMPVGVTKSLFTKYMQYYDRDIFVAAGREIRRLTKAADELPITERVNKIAQIFKCFKNPDKETVLTPWRVVNMHMSDIMGGWCYYNEDFDEKNPLEEPRFVDREQVTADVMANPDAKVLEMNSKSGLYPLFVAYSIYRAKLEDSKENTWTLEEQWEFWRETLERNVFVLCKTPMARSITNRTLAGYSGYSVNAIYLTKLLDRMQEPKRLCKKLTNPATWSKEGEKMRFDAIVGNPPYQETGGGGGTNDAPIYQNFVNCIDKLAPQYSSLIMPARWFTSGRENLLSDFREYMINNMHIQRLVTYADSSNIFPTVEIKGGICYYLMNLKYIGQCEYTLIENKNSETCWRTLNNYGVLIRKPILAEIVSKVMKYQNEERLSTIISNDTPFGIPTNPRASKKTPFPVYDTPDDTHNVRLYFIEDGKRTTAFVSDKDIKKNVELIPLHKALLTSAGGSGNDSIVLGTPQYAEANSVCSQSFIFAGFDTAEETKNFISYVKTKFVRILVSAIKISQQAPNKVYRFVPVQDFTKEWTDEELYDKYGLTDAEIAFIETAIKPIN